MLRSMTAFARLETQEDWGSAIWELRAVNHRYLDVYAKLPEEFRSLEQEVRKHVGARIKRGKLECTLRIQPTPGDTAKFHVDRHLAEQLAHASREVDQVLYNPAPVNAMDLLRWPGVLQVSAPDLERVGKAVLKLLDQTLKELTKTRAREGKKIRDFILARLDEMPPQLQAVRDTLPGLVKGMRERLTTRLVELRGEVDEHRLEQEIVLFAQKLDVAEELDRLHTHITEVRRVAGEDKPVGRRLDFLMQELNREANTLGSKSAATETTRAAVELKVIIEQMREQIQNVE